MTPSSVFTALADPTRRQIFEALRTKPKTVGELAWGRPVSRPAVSQHLKVLQSANLVNVVSQGTRHYYSIRREGLEELRKYVDSFWEETLSAFGDHVAKMMKEKN